MDYVVSREGLGYSLKSKLDDKQSDTLKTIIRQHWKEKLDSTIDKTKRPHIAAELESHILNMNAVVDPIDYEAFCVPNLIQHSKHMQRDDFTTYLRLIESMGVGYSDQLGKDLTNLILIGVTSKGRSVGSAERYLSALVADLNKKASYYKSKMDVKNRRIDLLANRLKGHQSSLFRFLLGRKIGMLTMKIERKKRQISSIKGRYEKYNGLIERVNRVKVRKPPSATPPKSPQN